MGTYSERAAPPLPVRVVRRNGLVVGQGDLDAGREPFGHVLPDFLDARTVDIPSCALVAGVVGSQGMAGPVGELKVDWSYVSACSICRSGLLTVTHV